jgi:ribose 5-phosphate isomerase B
MKIAIGSDHRGINLKSEIVCLLTEWGHEPRDYGAYDARSVDYPDIATLIGKDVSAGKSERGILICGTGIGMSIAANKAPGIRAALCCTSFMAERARLHNDANVLCLGVETALKPDEIVRAFLTSEYEGGRHQARLVKIEKMEIC